MSTKTVLSTRTVWRNAEGLYHRVDGPAVEWVNGSKEWYQNGKLHRENGPALEWYNGSEEWHFKGKKCSEEEHSLLTWKHLTQEQRDSVIFEHPDVD